MTTTSRALRCPRDHTDLVFQPHAGAYHCHQCTGDLIGIPVLRRLVEPETVNHLWRTARNDPDGRFTQGLTCPAGNHPMREITLGHTTHHNTTEPVTLDVCPSCHHLWVDPGEHQLLPPATTTPPERTDPDIHPDIHPDVDREAHWTWLVTAATYGNVLKWL